MKNNNLYGLTNDEVAQRIAEGKVNTSVNLKTKSIKRIFYDNIFTLFNAINIVLFVSLIAVGSYKNLLFIGVVLGNIAIGTFQEIRSKINVDRLTILSEKKVSVLREGEICQISREDIVLDDILMLSRGSQIPADCVVCDGECKVNESLLTGESDLIDKVNNSELLSGSFVAAGKCYARVTKVGSECYAARINNEAKYIKKINSHILKSFNFIIRSCTLLFFPLGIIFFLRQLGIQDGDIQGTVVSSVAALLGMIPKGMILLTSSVLAVSIIKLSQKKVLVQEMYCIETLARVDVLCLDKTGTLTTDEMNVTDVIYFDSDKAEVDKALASIVSASDEINATLAAIKDYTDGTALIDCKKFIPFSSETKWSGGMFSNGKSYIIGACEFIFKDRRKYKEVYNKLDSINQTVRILALAESDSIISNSILPEDLKPLAIILIKDKLRDNVNQTIDYFKEQGVTLKVISGDSVKTVQNIAIDTGIEGAENAVDMTTINTDEELKEVAERCNVFGRVTPAQKKQLVLALQEKGHSVAMTGDGVNDVLALKEADCSVAMASGSDAARNVSQLVLVNNDFASMPDVVAEGRRTINNLERSSSLYIVKTIYSIVLTLFFILVDVNYPFEPIQLSLVGAFIVAIPSFILALQPNANRIKGNFTVNIIARALPASLSIIFNVVVLAILSMQIPQLDREFSTLCVYLTTLSCMLLLIRLSIPLNLLRGVMLTFSIVCVVTANLMFREFFSLVVLSTNGVILLAIFATVTIIIFNVMFDFAQRYINKYNK